MSLISQLLSLQQVTSSCCLSAMSFAGSHATQVAAVSGVFSLCNCRGILAGSHLPWVEDAKPKAGVTPKQATPWLGSTGGVLQTATAAHKKISPHGKEMFCFFFPFKATSGEQIGLTFITNKRALKYLLLPQRRRNQLG